MLVSCDFRNRNHDSDLQLLYAELDREIARSHEYDLIKERRIDSLKLRLTMTDDERRRTEIVNSLIDEYNAYNADSTLKYINYNLDRRHVKGIPGEYTRLVIRRGDVLGHAGLFPDALAEMVSIPPDSITDELKEAYYSTYCAIWQYLAEYTADHETGRGYERRRSIYADSLRQTVDTTSFNHFVYVMAEHARNGDPDKAIHELEQSLKKYRSGSREYSILASTLSYIYKTAGRPEEYKHYLVKSAISDIQGAVKENVSFREMATLMFEEGDVERANKYLKKSIADANFYSALMRNAQSGKMLPVIDEAYSGVQEELHGRLRRMVWISSVLSFILLITVVLILKQIYSLRKAKDRVSAAKDKLSELSEELREANRELGSKNAELREFNRTKEQYAGLFMEYCSTAISSLQHYQQGLRIHVIQGGNRAGLMKKLESTEISDSLLKNFYVRFDEAILNIYPEFVEKFNSLLLPDRQVILKSGELLNTELRLFALIRLGIDDNAKIAEFLRCSLATVYTYRSRMKKRAINPDGFEEAVKEIG